MKLLFISDSLIQSPVVQPVQALQLFDDERYRILRDNRYNHGGLHIVIVSARYGIIPPDKLISPYRAAFSYEGVDKFFSVLFKQWYALKARLPLGEIDDLMICCVDEHRYVLQRVHVAIELIPKMKSVVYAQPGRGQQAQQLVDWLHT